MTTHVSFLRKSLVPATILFAVLAFVVYGPVLLYNVSPDLMRAMGAANSVEGGAFFPAVYAVLSFFNAVVGGGVIASELHRMWTVSLLLHVACSVLVFSAVGLLASWQDEESFVGRYAFGIALLAGLLFLLHPLQARTVLHVPWGQKELATSALVLGLLNAFLLYACGVARVATMVLSASAALLLCGAWEVALVMPALLLSVDWLFVARGDGADLKERLGIHVALVALAVVPLAYLFSTALMNDAVYGATELIGMGQHAGGLFFQHLASLIWPVGAMGASLLSFVPTWSLPIAALLLMVGSVVWVVRAGSDVSRVTAFCVAVLFATSFFRPTLVEHFYLAAEPGRYFGMLGVVFALSCVLIWFADELAVRVRWLNEHLVSPASRHAVLAALLIFPLGVQTAKRVYLWQSETSFWSDVAAHMPERAEAHVNHGFALLRERSSVEPVVNCFKHAIEVAPDNVDAHTGLAACHVRGGRLDEAITLLSDAVRLSPRSMELYVSLGSLLIRTKRFDSAERLLKTALRAEPRDVSIWASLARLHLSKGENEKAQAALKSACIELGVRERNLLDLLGRLSVSTQRYEDAEVAFRTLLVEAPGNSDAMIGRAHALHMLKRYDEAAGMYDELLQVQPGHKVATRGLAESYYLSGRLHEAILAFDKVRTFEDMASWADLRIAACYERLGEINKACEVIEHLLQTPLNERTKGVAEEYLAMLRSPRTAQASA